MAIGFWKFVVVTTFLIALFRGGSNFLGNAFGAFPFSIFLWVCYRVARLQEWWPFGRAADRPEDKAWSRLGELVGDVRKQLEQNGSASPLTAKDLQRMALKSLGSRAASKSASSVDGASRRNTIHAPAPKLSISRKKIAPPSTSPARMAPLEPEVFKALSEKISTVGVRSKTQRTKTKREKKYRTKRRPSPT